MASYDDVAKQFVEFYYNTFDTNRAALANLYRAESMLTFESNSDLGVAKIVERLSSLPFEKVKHQITTFDSQPSPNNGILIFITGALLVDEEQRPMGFTQAFQLLPDGAGGYFVHNDIFRLIFT